MIYFYQFRQNRNKLPALINMFILLYIAITTQIFASDQLLSNIELHGKVWTKGNRVFHIELKIFGSVSGRFAPGLVEVTFDSGRTNLVNATDIINLPKSCAICYEEGFEFEHGRVIALPCTTIPHIFCQICIEKTFHEKHLDGYRMKCPICREDVDHHLRNLPDFGLFPPQHTPSDSFIAVMGLLAAIPGVEEYTRSNWEKDLHMLNSEGFIAKRVIRWCMEMIVAVRNGDYLLAKDPLLHVQGYFAVMVDIFDVDIYEVYILIVTFFNDTFAENTFFHNAFRVEYLNVFSHTNELNKCGFTDSEEDCALELY